MQNFSVAAASPDLPEFMISKQTKRSTYYYWQPSKALRKLGHRPCPLGTDLAEAIKEAIRRNDKVRKKQSGSPREPRIVYGTVSWLTREFKDNHRFLNKRKKTREGYTQCMNIIEEHFGDAPITVIGRAVLEKFYNKMHKRTPWQANAVMTMFRRILFFAMAIEKITVNPASKMELTSNKARYQKWEDEELDLFLPVALEIRRSIYLATILGVELGQREADILKLRGDDLTIAGYNVLQNKGGAIVTVPLSERLRKALATVPPGSDYLVVSEITGRPYTQSNFSHVFAAIRTAAEAKGFKRRDLRYQDLRRTCIVNLARAGCTPLEIAAITGHMIDTVVDILEHYLPRDSVVAANAIKKLDRWRTGRSKSRKAKERAKEMEKAKEPRS
jgi:integrase